MVAAALTSERFVRARTPSDLAAWASAVDGALTRFDIAPPSPSSFDGSLRTRSVGRTTMTTIDSTGHILRHGPSKADRDSIALVTLVEGGTADVTQSGHREVLRPGDIALHFSANACEVICDDDYRCFSIGVPAGVLALGDRWWGDPERMIIRRDSPLGEPLGHTMSGLRSAVGAVAPVSLSDVVDGTVHLIGSLLRGDPAAGDGPEPGERTTLLDAIDEFIWANLADPELDASTIARANHLSVRRVYQLLAAVGETPAALIRRRRLERVRRELADASATRRTVSESAARWGLTNPSHFSAMFSAAYGTTPSRYAATSGGGAGRALDERPRAEQPAAPEI